MSSTARKPTAGRGSGRSPGAGDAIPDGAPPVKPSPSASLVLLAPLQERTRDGFDYRVLLLKRNARSTTFFSAHVFPGGNVDPIDSASSAWSSLFPSDQPLSADEAKTQTVKICAVRETFEECGILLMEENGEKKGNGREKWAALGEKERKAWRDKVHDDGNNFVELFKFLNAEGGSLRPGLSTLQYRANWITPANMKRRYDTAFFLTILPPSASSPPTPSSTDSPTATPVHQDHIATADNGETVSADWLTPLEAIERTLAHTASLQTSEGPAGADRSNIILFPPQFYLLAELVSRKSWRDVLDSQAKDLEGRPIAKPRHVAAFGPELRGCQDGKGVFRPATVLVGDPEHSQTDPSTLKPTDRHRTYVLLPSKPKPGEEEAKWKAKAPLGLTVMGVHRQGMDRLFGEGWEDMKEGDIGEGGFNGAPSQPAKL